MLRFLVHLFAVLLFLGMPFDPPPTGPVDLAALATDSCHCCPDGEEEEGDCCDWDFGACCATGMAAALPTSQSRLAQHVAALPSSPTSQAIHLLRPRDNGPPPTPPPIG